MGTAIFYIKHSLHVKTYIESTNGKSERVKKCAIFFLLEYHRGLKLGMFLAILKTNYYAIICFFFAGPHVAIQGFAWSETGN